MAEVFTSTGKGSGCCCLETPTGVTSLGGVLFNISVGGLVTSVKHRPSCVVLFLSRSVEKSSSL